MSVMMTVTSANRPLKPETVVVVNGGDDDEEWSVTAALRPVDGGRFACWLPLTGSYEVLLGYVDTVLDAEALLSTIGPRWLNDEVAIPDPN